MNLVFQFNDSEIATIKFDGNHCTLVFSTAHVRDPAQKLDGYITGLSLELRNTTLVKRDSGCVGRLQEGSLILGGGRLRECSLPSPTLGPVDLDLTFSNGSVFQCHAEQGAFRIKDASQFYESFKC